VGRPRTMDTDKITTLDANPHLMVREIQEILGMSHGSVVASQRCQLCEQNGYMSAARTERQELAARKEQRAHF